MNALVWPFLFLIVGLLLLTAEVFIPSGGLIGILAISCLVLSVWKAFVYSTPMGLYFLLGLLILMPLALMLAAHLWPRTPFAKRILLRPPTPEDVDPSQTGIRLDHLVGQFGRALTPLRPSGMVDFDGRRLDGLSEEGLIPSGALVRAVQVRSGQLVVREARDPTASEISSSKEA